MSDDKNKPRTTVELLKELQGHYKPAGVPIKEQRRRAKERAQAALDKQKLDEAMARLSPEPIGSGVTRELGEADEDGIADSLDDE